MFADGLVYEGVSEKAQFFRGPSAALDLMMPTLDRLFWL